MIFVNNISQLSYYSPNPQWGCYGEPLLQPSDILLQANGFPTAATDVSVFINVCDTAGNFQEIATTYFAYNIRQIVIAGITYTYVNIQGSNFSPFMISNRCFTLNVVVIDNATGNILFNKWTEKYDIQNTTPSLVPSELSINDIPQTPCIPLDNPALCTILGGDYVDFRVGFGCVDVYSGDIYADGEVLYAYGEPFNYYRRSLIQGNLRPIPSGVVREISINCRTQRSEITPLWVLNGAYVYPEWKMREIEDMMLAQHLYFDGVEYQSAGGTYFEQFGRPFNCKYVYKMTLNLQKCRQWQIFGCVDECISTASFYAIPRPFSRVYNDDLRLIAESVNNLVLYFQSIPGTTMATETNYVMPCPNETTIKVISSGQLPRFLYLDYPLPAYRVFAKQLPVNTTDVSTLCNGISNNNIVQPPVITGQQDEDLQVDVPVITGEDDVSATAFIPQITAEQGWTLDNNYTSAVSYAGEVTLNISASTTTYSSPFSLNLVGYISAEGRPIRDIALTSTNNGNLPIQSTLEILTTGEIYYTGPATSQAQQTNILELFMIKYPL